MKRGILFFTILSFFIPANDGFSEEKLSLKQALSIAFENNPQMVESRKELEIAEFQYKQSRKWNNPEIDIDVGKLPKDLESDSSIKSRELEGEVRVTQFIDGWGKKNLKNTIGQNELEQKKIEFQQNWVEVVRLVKDQYAETILHQKLIEVMTENLEISRKLMEQVQIRFESGQALNHELSRAKLELIEARNELLTARKEIIIDKGKLNVLLGRNMADDLTLEDNFSVVNFDETYDELLTIAQNKRQDINIQQKEVEKQELAVKLAKRSRLPSYGLSLFVEREEEIYSGGIGLTFELPIWNHYGNEIKAAKISREIAALKLETLKKTVSLDVYIAFHEADLTRKSIEMYKEAIKEANEILRLSTIGYEEGEIEFIEYLSNITAYQQTKQKYFESVVHYYKKLAFLEQSVGEELKNDK